MSKELFNKSGIIPLGHKVLIKLTKLEKKTIGGIIIPDDVLDKEQFAGQVAEVYDLGPAAFSIGISDLPLEWKTSPKVSSKILINKYAGIGVQGLDKEDYRLINDSEILAILNE